MLTQALKLFLHVLGRLLVLLHCRFISVTCLILSAGLSFGSMYDCIQIRVCVPVEFLKLIDYNFIYRFYTYAHLLLV